jgi:hypothetical protein
MRADADGRIMDKLSTLNQGKSSEKTDRPSRIRTNEQKDKSYTGKLVRTATKEIDETVVWDEV